MSISFRTERYSFFELEMGSHERPNSVRILSHLAGQSQHMLLNAGGWRLEPHHPWSEEVPRLGEAYSTRRHGATSSSFPK